VSPTTAMPLNAFDSTVQSFVPAELVDALGGEAAYGLLEGAARAKAAQTVESDPERARVQARWKRDNDYSNARSAWMAAHR
jgi:anti-sigma-K factor RskA